MTIVLDIIVNTILVIGAISLFNLILALLKVRKVLKMQKDNPNIQGISIINGEVKVIEKGQNLEGVTEEKPKDMVVDTVCHKELKKEDAYRVFKDGKEYFFCSWECREAFLKENQEEKQQEEVLQN